MQRALELLAEVDRPVLDHHRADGQQPILVQVQPGGFQVEYHPALLAQAAITQLGHGRQALQTLLQFAGQNGVYRAQP
ncbi:hypothetical protein D3C87_2062090 [compost metagenome]